MRYSPSNKPDLKANALQDAQDLKKAFDGFGCDSTAVNSIMCRRTPWHLNSVYKEYQRLYNRDLFIRIKDELSSAHEHLILALIHDHLSIDAYIIFYASSSSNFDIDNIMIILATRTEEEIRMIKERYKTLYGRNLMDAFYSRTTSWCRDALVSLLDLYEYRDISQDKAYQYACKIDKMRGEITRSVADVLIDVFCKSDEISIYKVLKEYKKLTNKSLVENLKQTTYFEKLIYLKALYIEDPAKLFATYLNEGIAKRHITKIITIVSVYYHSYMGNILEAYEALFERDLSIEICEKFSNDPRTVEALMMLLGDK